MSRVTHWENVPKTNAINTLLKQAALNSCSLLMKLVRNYNNHVSKKNSTQASLLEHEHGSRCAPWHPGATSSFHFPLCHAHFSFFQAHSLSSLSHSSISSASPQIPFREKLLFPFKCYIKYYFTYHPYCKQPLQICFLDASYEPLSNITILHCNCCLM